MTRSRVINTIGFGMTAVVLVVVLITKFTHGAWIAILAMAVLFVIMRGIHAHYQAVARELAVEVYRSLMEIIGPNAHVRDGSPAAVLRGRLERYHRSALVMTFGGGTNEIQRDIIGMVGLGLPAAKR